MPIVSAVRVRKRPALLDTLRDPAIYVREFEKRLRSAGSWVTTRRIAAIATIAIAAASALGCDFVAGQPNHARNVESLDKVVETLASLRIEGVAFIDDSCTYVRYKSAEYAIGRSPSECHRGQVASINNVVAADLEIIADTFAALGWREVSGFLEYGSPGNVLGAGFSLGGCAFYTYEPSYASLPSIEWQRVERIDEDWYFEASLSSAC